MDKDGDGEFSIIDINWLKENFPENSVLGKDIEEIFQEYMNRNVRSKFIKQKFTMDFINFQSFVPLCSLVADLQYAFNKRLFDEIEFKEMQVKMN